MSLYLGNQKISNLGETFTPREIQSVNGKYSVGGNITVYGSDTQVSENDTRKIDEALSSITDELTLINSKIPTQATSTNKLADIAFVDSVISSKVETSSVYWKNELSVVNLSGLFEDETQFSYNVIIKL